MQNFIQDETGAVTVDWVVLTAALVGLGLAVMAVVSGGIETQAEAIDSTLTDESIIRTAFTGNAVNNFNSACAGFGGCDSSLANLSDLSNTDFNALRDAGPIDNTTGIEAAYAGSGIVQDPGGSGDWGTVDPGTGTFTADSSATDAYNAAAAYDAAANAAIAAEDGARSNN